MLFWILSRDKGSVHKSVVQSCHKGQTGIFFVMQGCRWFLSHSVPKEERKYSDDKKQYRTYKIARMQNLEEMDRVSNIDHGDIKKLMKESEQAYYQTSIPIEVQFANEETALMEEYFPDCPIEQISEDTKRMFIDVPAKERLWKALLLSFGNKVKVIGPEEYRKELIRTAQNFLSNYDIQLS